MNNLRFFIFVTMFSIGRGTKARDVITNKDTLKRDFLKEDEEYNPTRIIGNLASRQKFKILFKSLE